MKNILIVISDITYRNGTERAVCNLANMLSNSNRYNVTIVSVKNSEGTVAFPLNKNVDVSFLDIPFNGGILTHTCLYFKVLKKIDKLCMEKDIDIVIGTESGFNYILPFLSYKIKKIGCEHFGWNRSRLHHKIIRKIMYRFLSAVVVLTENDFVSYSFLRNVHVIPNSFSFVNTDYAKFDNKTIIAIGRLTYQKGFDRLINIISNVKELLPDYKVYIYGQGPLKEELLDQIYKNDLDGYLFLMEPVKDIQTVYKNSSIYVMTSRFEGLPMVLIEAQSYGIPIVSYNCPEGPSEVIINEKNGFLIPEGDEDSFVEKLLLVAKNQSLWEELHKSSILQNERFSTKTVFEKWEKLFSEVCQ